MSGLEALARSISQNVSTITSFLKTENHTEFSFDPSSPARFPADASIEVSRARQDLLWAARQMQYLALGPTESLQLFTISGALDTVSLRWIYHYDIPAQVPINTGIPFADLSLKTKLLERTLTRILRHAMTNNIFVENVPGHVSHTSLSLQLAIPGNPIRGMVGHLTEAIFPTVSKLVEAHDKYGTEDDLATHTPFQIAFDTEKRALDWWTEDPVSAPRFAESMKFASSSSGPFSTKHIVKSFDWESLADGVMVDVGGSAGHVSKVIAASATRLRFVIQDLPAMVAKGEAELEPIYKKRFQFQTHDFFDPNPVQKPDAFLLRWIIHDWPDPDAIIIIQKLARNMGPNTTLLINEVVVPAKDSIHPLREKQIRNMDLVMMAALNSLERTLDEWNALIAKADPRLRVVGVETPPGSAMSMISIKKSEE